MFIIIMCFFVYFRWWIELCGVVCIIVSVDDMVKFMNFLLNGGKMELGFRLVDEEKIKEFFLLWIYL